ncbi:MAG: hypothetical protein C0608_08695 [Deltaproteobacteria bacterium]|nr:MAG: hypothetical protein C0608_08695 [Deltaproteobacteria bacterium]
MKGAKGFILAAGFGKRMLPFTESVAKAALPFFGKPLAAWSLEALRGAGVEDVTVNLHHLGDTVKGALAPYVDDSFSLRWSEEETLLGTGGGVKRCISQFVGGELFLLNGDTFRELDLKRMAELHAQMDAVATLALAPAEAGREAPIEVGPDGRIVKFLGAGPGGGRPCEFIGAHLFSPEGIEVIGAVEATSFCINAEVNTRLVSRGAKVFGVVLGEDDWWCDLGTPERFMEGHIHFFHRGSLPPGCGGRLLTHSERADGGGEVIAPSWVAEGGVVEEDATAGPYAVLGSGSRVAAGVTVQSTILFPGASALSNKRGVLAAPGGLEVSLDL